MNEPENRSVEPRIDWENQVARKEKRKLQARSSNHPSVWFGLGTFGLIGWSIALPALLGIAAGLWIDHRFPSRLSWTLMMLVAGVALGCFNAWRWVDRETRDLDEPE